MSQRQHPGPLSLIVVAVISALCGALGGAFAANRATSSSSRIGSSSRVQTATTSANSVVSTVPLSWVEIARRVGHGVVTIVNKQQGQPDIFGNMQPSATVEGSGFAIDRKGDIVTNNHVVESAAALTVVFSNGKKSTASLVRTDPLTDIAVIRVSISAPAILSFGNSGTLQPGEPVLAIGSALGEYRNTVTSGIISALGCAITEPSGTVLQNMEQSDAAINEGNSGGPLLNDRGQVVGVNTVIARGALSNDPFAVGQSIVAEGLGFAVPSNTVGNVVARLVQNKPLAFLGVIYHQVTQLDSVYYGLPTGAYINSLAVGSPAAKAGLRTQDIITRIDARPMTDSYQLQEVVAAHAPGQKLKMTVWRAGKTLSMRVRLSVKPHA